MSILFVWDIVHSSFFSPFVLLLDPCKKKKKTVQNNTDNKCCWLDIGSLGDDDALMEVL